VSKIAKRVRLLKSKKGKKLSSDKIGAQFERDIFIGFYSVRKLIEAPTKVTDATRNMQVKVTNYMSLNKPVHHMNNHKIDELYDLENAHQEIRNLPFVAGRIIHSFIFMPYVDETDRLDGIFFTSDTDKDKRIYSMKIDDVIDIFERVGNDYPTKIFSFIDLESGKMTTIVS